MSNTLTTFNLQLSPRALSDQGMAIWRNFFSIFKLHEDSFYLKEACDITILPTNSSLFWRFRMVCLREELPCNLSTS